MPIQDSREIWQRMCVLKSVLLLYNNKELRKFAKDYQFLVQQRMREETSDARMQCIEKANKKEEEFYEAAEKLFGESDIFQEKEIIDFIRHTCFNASYMTLYQVLVNFSLQLPSEFRTRKFSEINFSQSTMKKFLISLVFVMMKEEEKENAENEEVNSLISTIKENNAKLKDDLLGSIWNFIEKVEEESLKEEKKEKEKIERLVKENIYRLDTPYHIIGWLLFLIIFSSGYWFIYQEQKKRKEKKTTNSLSQWNV